MAADLSIIKRTLIAASGNFLEWFDFANFGIFATEIGDHFFPPSDPQTQLIQSFSVFAGAFLIRPVGGALFAAASCAKWSPAYQW